MEEIFKAMQEAFISLAREAATAWESIKELVQCLEADDRYGQPIHPALRNKNKNSINMVPQVLMNKPKMIYARTNC